VRFALNEAATQQGSPKFNLGTRAKICVNLRNLRNLRITPFLFFLRGSLFVRVFPSFGFSSGGFYSSYPAL